MVRVHLAAAPLVKVVVIAFGLWVLLQVFGRVLSVFVLIACGLVLAAAISPIVSALHQSQLLPGSVRLQKSIAVLLVFIGSLVGLLLTGYVIGGRAVDELAQLTDALFASTTAAGRDVSDWLQAFGVPRSLQPSSSEIASFARGFADNALGIAHAFVSSLVRFIFQFFIVLLLAAFLVIDSERFSLFPQPSPSRLLSRMCCFPGSIDRSTTGDDHGPEVKRHARKDRRGKPSKRRTLATGASRVVTIRDHRHVGHDPDRGAGGGRRCGGHRRGGEHRFDDQYIVERAFNPSNHGEGWQLGMTSAT